MGIIESLIQASTRRIKVKILMPIEYEAGEEIIRKIQPLREACGLEIRIIKSLSAEPVKIIVVVADRKASLIVELRDDSKLTFIEAVGSAVYVASRPEVLSYVTIFDILWNQSELYEQVRELLNKKLEGK